jgi:hypothetical protein
MRPSTTATPSALRRRRSLTSWDAATTRKHKPNKPGSAMRTARALLKSAGSATPLSSNNVQQTQRRSRTTKPVAPQVEVHHRKRLDELTSKWGFKPVGYHVAGGEVPDTSTTHHNTHPPTAAPRRAATASSTATRPQSTLLPELASDADDDGAGGERIIEPSANNPFARLRSFDEPKAPSFFFGRSAADGESSSTSTTATTTSTAAVAVTSAHGEGQERLSLATSVIVRPPTADEALLSSFSASLTSSSTSVLSTTRNVHRCCDRRVEALETRIRQLNRQYAAQSAAMDALKARFTGQADDAAVHGSGGGDDGGGDGDGGEQATTSSSLSVVGAMDIPAATCGVLDLTLPALATRDVALSEAAQRVAEALDAAATADAARAAAIDSTAHTIAAARAAAEAATAAAAEASVHMQRERDEHNAAVDALNDGKEMASSLILMVHTYFRINVLMIISLLRLFMFCFQQGLQRCTCGAATPSARRRRRRARRRSKSEKSRFQSSTPADGAANTRY